MSAVSINTFLRLDTLKNLCISKKIHIIGEKRWYFYRFDLTLNKSWIFGGLRQEEFKYKCNNVLTDK